MEPTASSQAGLVPVPWAEAGRAPAAAASVPYAQTPEWHGGRGTAAHEAADAAIGAEQTVRAGMPVDVLGC